MLLSFNELALARKRGNHNAMKTRLKTSLIAASIAALPFGADAAGLGRLNVMSALGQPLRAEVELSATAQEMQSLTARVPSAEAFKQANVAYSPAMANVRLAIEQRGGRSVVKITSDKPVSAPFVDMLIELHWTGGQVLREYTFLLDPADMAPPRAVVETTAPVARPMAPAPLPKASRPAADTASGGAGSGGGTYEVKSGDTLGRIAAETRPDGVSLDQMVVALFRGNRSAFEADNINRLKSGKILNVPDAAKAQAIPPAEARKEILAHSADFEGYRRNLAATVAAAPAQPAPTAGQESGGKITPKVAEPSATAPAKDQVKVSSLEAARPGENTGSAARLQALEEDIVARDKALKEANVRLAELEKSIQELQKLVELRNQGMAQAQQAAQGAASPAAPSPTVAPPAPPPAEVAAPAATPAAPATPAPEAVAPPPPKPKPVAPPPPVEQPGFLASLLSDPMTLAGGGGILALLLGYVGFKMRSRRQAGQAGEPIASQLSQFPESTQSVVGATGGQTIDTGNSSLLQTDFSQSGLAAIDADEGVDPVAEADVYMAYGRDAQAEEILIDALKVDSSRGAVYVKLLEIYAHRKSLKQFESLATDFYSMTGGKGPDWEKAAAIGRKLDPSNPLYGAPGQESDGAGAGKLAAVAAGGAAASLVAARPEPVMEFSDTQGSAVSMKETWALPGELSQLTESMDDAVDVDLTASLPVTPTAKDLAPPVEESSALDFNLDLGEPLQSTETAAPVPPVEVVEDAAGLDFNLDVGPDTVPAEELKPARPTETGDQAMVATMIDGDAFRLDAGDIPSAADELEFDLPVEEAPRKNAVDLSATMIADAGAPDSGEVDLEKTSFNPDMLDFDFELDEGGKQAAPAPAVDLSGIDLNLDVVGQETTLEPLDLGTPDAFGEAPGDAAGGEEVDTKLELARAYEEMGDREGARELLEEVLKEGSTEQKNAARTLLGRLG